MLSLINDELNEAMGYLWEDDYVYAYHTGKAGGIAAAIGAQGFFFDSLCDEISNAYEQVDLAAGYDEDFDGFDKEQFEDLSDYIRDLDGAFWSIIVHLNELPDGDTRVDNAVDTRIGWEEYGVSLNNAVQAKEDGDELRYALMIGFVSGLMFRDPGPQYPEGSILDAITEGYEEDRGERVQWAQARLAAAHRLSDPGPFMGKNAYDRYMKEKLQMMRWVQNFGLRNARADDERVALPILSAGCTTLSRRVYEYEEGEFEVVRTSLDSVKVNLICEKHDHLDLIVDMSVQGVKEWVTSRAGDLHVLDETFAGDDFSEAIEHCCSMLLEECEASVQVDEFFTDDVRTIEESLDVSVPLSTDEDDDKALTTRLYEFKEKQLEAVRTSPDSAIVNLKCGKHEHEDIIIGRMDGERGWLIGRKEPDVGPRGPIEIFAEAVEHCANMLVEECEAFV